MSLLSWFQYLSKRAIWLMETRDQSGIYKEIHMSSPISLYTNWLSGKSELDI